MMRLADRYRLDAEIGRGSGSVVYRAYDERTHALCALKILRTTRRPPELCRRFAREVALMTELRHPHILRVFDFDLDAQRPWMAMPFARAGSVRTYLDRRGALPVGDAVVHSVEILGALEAAHRASIIHRDIKPSNLLKTASGLKVADFGIAGLLHDQSHTGPLGSMAYMAPELRTGTFGVASDLFSLGITLFVMLTNGNPFDLCADDLNSSRMRKVPSGLRGVIHRAIRPSPHDRYGTPAEMAEAILQTAAGTAFAPVAEQAAKRSMPLAGRASTGYPGG